MAQEIGRVQAQAEAAAAQAADAQAQLVDVQGHVDMLSEDNGALRALRALGTEAAAAGAELRARVSSRETEAQVCVRVCVCVCARQGHLVGLLAVRKVPEDRTGRRSPQHASTPPPDARFLITFVGHALWMAAIGIILRLAPGFDHYPFIVAEIIESWATPLRLGNHALTSSV
jgi:hypothetical protein